MTSFTDVPIEDINYLLINNNLPTSGDKYNTSLKFIESQPNIDVPISIADWIIARNLLIEGVNIPTMTPLDIITSKNKLLNLPDERIIQIMRYLHKLDERDLFKDLPLEIIAKIFSDLDCEQLLILCKMSKQFKFTCDNYLMDILKIKFSEEGYNLKGFNPTILCKSIKLNKKTIRIEEFTLLVGTNGKVYKRIFLKDFPDPYEFYNMENIISITSDNKNIYLLNSFGEVYKSHYEMGKYQKNGTIMLSIIEEPIKMESHPKNIIQIIGKDDYLYSLDINGNVFKNNEQVKTIKNIIRFFSGNSSPKKRTVFFMDTNNDLYKLDENKLSIPNIDNVLDVVINDNATNISVITKNGFLRIFDKNGKIKDLYIDALKNSIKIQIKKNILYSLNNEGIFQMIDLDNLSELMIEDNIKDFVTDLTPVNRKLILLSNDGYLHPVNLKNQDENKTVAVGVNAKLIDFHHISINDKLYRIDSLLTTE